MLHCTLPRFSAGQANCGVLLMYASFVRVCALAPGAFYCAVPFDAFITGKWVLRKRKWVLRKKYEAKKREHKSYSILIIEDLEEKEDLYISAQVKINLGGYPF